jgi:hypothetical protein
MDEKSTLVFQAQLHIGGEKFSVMVCLSYFDYISL